PPPSIPCNNSITLGRLCRPKLTAIACLDAEVVFVIRKIIIFETRHASALCSSVESVTTNVIVNRVFVAANIYGRNEGSTLLIIQVWIVIENHSLIDPVRDYDSSAKLAFQLPE